MQIPVEKRHHSIGNKTIYKPRLQGISRHRIKKHVLCGEGIVDKNKMTTRGVPAHL